MRWTLLLVLLALAGCKKAPPPIVAVSGLVTLDGQPLAKAQVCFYPLQEGIPGDYIATAVTDDEGKYTLVTNTLPGACACENQVIVYEGPPSDEARKNQNVWDRYVLTLKNRPIPPLYGTLASSPLKVTVTAGQSDYPLQLKR